MSPSWTTRNPLWYVRFYEELNVSMGRIQQVVLASSVGLLSGSSLSGVVGLAGTVGFCTTGDC